MLGRSALYITIIGFKTQRGFTSRRRAKTMIEGQWKSLAGTEVDITEKIKEHSDQKYNVHVGSDSCLNSGEKFRLITTICFREPGKGVIVFYRSKKPTSPNTLYKRLQLEVLDSIDVASKVQEISGRELTVHIDINPDKKFESNKFYDELVGMVKGCGFECITKPDAFASAIADMYTR